MILLPAHASRRPIPLPPWRIVLRPLPYLVLAWLAISVVALAVMWRIAQ